MKNFTYPYCRLETYCFLNIECSFDRRQEKPLFFTKYDRLGYKDDADRNLKYGDDYNVNVEEYDSFHSVINRLSTIEETWRENISMAVAENSADILCVSVELYNRWGNQLTVGMYLDRLLLYGISKYTYEWRDNLFGTGNKQVRLMYLPMPDESLECVECEFIPQKKAYFLLREWLENNNYSKDFSDEMYYSYLEEKTLDETLDYSDSIDPDEFPF